MNIQRFRGQVEPFIPASSFLGGVGWDAFTLGKVVNPSDLLILLFYYLAGAGVLLLLARGVTFRFSQYLKPLLQFLFGGLFSALVIFYFKSSGSLAAYVVVFFLALLLILNEFLKERYENLTLSLSFFCLCGTMFLHFAIPHLVKSYHPFWFFFSTAIALAIVIAIWRKGTANRGSIVPTVIVSLVLVFVYLMKWIPPVPMVLKNSLVCRDFSKKATTYACKVEEQPFLGRIGLAADRFSYREGEKIYYLSSVFAPSGVEATIEHRWYQWNEKREEWLGSDTIPFPIKGGRTMGWRIYSNKKSIRPGRYRVETSLDESKLGYHTFEVVMAGDEPLLLKDTELE